MALRTYADFESKILPTLAKIDPGSKTRFLENLYTAAELRVEAEVVQASIRSTPGELATFRQKRKLVEMALLATRQADDFFPIRFEAFYAPSGFLSPVRTSLDFRDVIAKLQTAIEMCNALIKQKIPRRQRTNDGTLIPSADGNFMIEVERICKEFKYRNVNKLLSDVFDAAFDLRYSIERVIMARKRLRKAHSSRK